MFALLERRATVALSLLLATLVAGCGADQAPTVDEQQDSGAGLASSDDANAAIAAAVPSTDIWIVPLAAVTAGKTPAGAKNITRRRGYDNQPAFSASGDTLYYSSIHDDQQADIYAYDLATGVTRRVTATAQSEYSPTPHGDGISTVQVALDGTQRLWQYAADGTPRHAIRNDITGVGYHAWLPDGRVALFLVTEPVSLVVVHPDSDVVAEIATDIGRSLHALDGGRLAYVQKSGDDNWAVNVYDTGTLRVVRQAATRAGVEDMAWLADGSALMGEGQSVFALAPDASEWTERISLARIIPGDIGRMAVDPSGRWLALVVTHTE